jgi:hypothetical protein
MRPIIREYFWGASDHPLTADWVRRVQPAGGSVSTQSRQAHNYLAGALVGTLGLDPANLYGHTFDGGINGIAVPFFNRAGAVGNASNNGYVEGDYSDALGLAQSGSKYLVNASVLTSNFNAASATFFAAYHSAALTSAAVIMGAAGLVSFEIRNSAGTFARGILHSSTSLSADGAAAPTAACRCGYAATSATDLRFYRNGAQDGATQTGTRSTPTGTTALGFGVYGTGSAPCLATQCVSLALTVGLTAAQMDALSAIVREYLIRRGRPPCE